MKNYIKPGDIVTMIASADVAGGAGHLVGSFFGVAVATAVEDDPVELATFGEYDLAKAASQAWTVGVKVYWDDTAKLCTTTASGNRLVGAATLAAASDDATGRVYLDGAIR